MTSIRLFLGSSKRLIILKILVPHDGSRISNKAFDKALQFARQLNCEILLLHIIDLKLLHSDSILKYIHQKSELEKAKTQLLSYLKAGAESILKDNVERAKKKGVNVIFTLGMGSTCNVANDESVDFIIIGSTGLSSGDNQTNKLKVLGSVARRVSELADCPVMIVK